jgi:hypothetical protein
LINDIDAIGRRRKSSNLGLLWTTEELQLLNACQSDRSRPQAAIKYLEEAKKLGYPIRSKSAIDHRLNRFFRDNKIKFAWTQDEDNHLIELFQEYPFEIAFKKYQHWAETRNYPIRDRDPIYGRLSKLGVSIIDPVVVAGMNSIARSLGLASQTVTKFVRKSGIKIEQVGQKIVCEADRFYQWFVSSGSWIKCLRGCAQTGSKPNLDSWSILLNIPVAEIQAEWRNAKNSLLRVRSPLAAESLLVADFAKREQVTANAIRTAIRQGRMQVSGVKFEVCSDR